MNTFTDELERAIKYVSWDRDLDWYPKLVADPIDLNAHRVYADWLDDRAENPQDAGLAERIRHEAARNLLGHPIRPVRLGDEFSTHDFVLHALRTGHQNPTVRALAGERNGEQHPELINFLLHSDRPYDHDAAIWLAPKDSDDSHAAHSILKRIDSPDNIDAGLEAKVVRGTAYLLDHDAPDHRAYGAPAIVFTAPVNDHNELAEMATHADRIRSERTQAGAGTHVGPAHFGS